MKSKVGGDIPANPGIKEGNMDSRLGGNDKKEILLAPPSWNPKGILGGGFHGGPDKDASGRTADLRIYPKEVWDRWFVEVLTVLSHQVDCRKFA